jgi:SAM-dependent methyltransferase
VLNPFERSAEFYDELYEEKNYTAEADYVDGLIQKNLPGPKILLDLGCGTGRHAIKFAEKGYNVVGVDRSPEMIAKAHARQEQAPPHIRKRLTFKQGDIRDIRLGRQLDVVVALFHVISYQISNADFIAAFTTARAHLRQNGIFIFDCWYGPGVLSDLPVARTKTLYNGLRRLTRFAQPVMRVNENVVEVNYSFELADAPSHTCSEFHEKHVMRYFFVPELFLALETVGLKPLLVTEWMSQREPGLATWSVAVVAKG